MIDLIAIAIGCFVLGSAATVILALYVYALVLFWRNAIRIIRRRS